MTIKLNIRVSLAFWWARFLRITRRLRGAPFGRLGYATFSPSLRYGENVANAGNVICHFFHRGIMNEIVIGIFTISGVLIGGLLQFLFTRNINKDDFKRSSEYNAYLEYINAVVGVKMAQKNNNSKSYADNLSKLTEAKAKILVAGSFETNNALKDFENYGPVIRDNVSSELFAKIIQSMRKSLGEKKTINFRDIESIILGGGKNDI